MDPDEQRARLRDNWERAAAGWAAQAERMHRVTLPVSRWLIDAVRLQPGHRVLELAAGPGDTGFLAAELVAPGGTLVCTDASEPMLDVARARAERLGVENVEFEVLELEWLDKETASVDAVLCRWGYMFALDPEAALREARRVLRSGGRLALAAWDAPQANPWATATGQELVRLGHAEPPDPEAPGMFTLAAPGRIESLLHGAGFEDVEVDTVAFEQVFADLDEYWEFRRDLARPFADALQRLDAGQQAELRDAVGRRLQPFAAPDGSLRLPARTYVAAAGA